MNSGISKLVSRVTRHSISIVSIMAIAWLPLLYGTQQVLRIKGSDVRQWLPSSFQETHEYDAFTARFGSDEVIVMSWPGCTNSDPRLNQLVNELRESKVEYESLFVRIASGPELVAQLVDSENGISRRLAKQRLMHVVFGPDGQTTAIIGWLSEKGTSDRHAAIERIYDAVERVGLTRDELRIGGPTMESVALDVESQRSRGPLTLLAGLGASLLGWYCLRHWRLVAIVFGVAIYCASASLALVYFTGNRLNILMMSMPTLIYVLAISAGVHWVNYLRRKLPEMQFALAVESATHEAALPVALTAFTTAIGLGSLSTSQVEPIRSFGIYAGAGVLLSVPILLLLLPSLTKICLDAKGLGIARNERPGRGLLQRFIVRAHWPLLITSVGTMFVFGAGLLRLETSVHLMNLFSDDTRIIRDYRWLESNIGPLVPVEVVLDFPHGNELPLVDRVRVVSDLQRRMSRIDGIAGTLSAATWTPPIPQGNSFRSFSQRRLLGLRLEQNLKSLAQTGFLVSDADRQSFRISARVESLSRPDYGHLADRIAETAHEVLQREGNMVIGADDTRVSITVTGAMPLVYKAQRVLLYDLFKSFCGASILIGITLMILLRSLIGGLLALVPNVLPALVTFGGMGWSGMICDVGAMMTASVAMGISVDDTIHLLFAYRRERAIGSSIVQATLSSVARCGNSMWQTTMICGVSMFAFALSDFVPTAHFAMLMFCMLTLALFGDLVMLPAMLLSGVGRFFDHRAAHDARRSQRHPRASRRPYHITW